MPAPYSTDLRSKVIEAYERGLGTVQEVAKIFNISTSSLNNYLRKKKETGDVSPLPATGGPKTCINGKGLDMVANEVQKKPDITLQALCDKYYEEFKIKVNDSMMCRALQSLNLNRKKKSYYAAEQEREDVKKNH